MPHYSFKKFQKRIRVEQYFKPIILTFWVFGGGELYSCHTTQTAQISCRPTVTSSDGYSWFILADMGLQVAE